jgi:hypothetical protein
MVFFFLLRLAGWSMDWKGLIAWKAIASARHTDFPPSAWWRRHRSSRPLLIRTHFCQDKHVPRYYIRIFFFFFFFFWECVYMTPYILCGVVGWWPRHYYRELGDNVQRLCQQVNHHHHPVERKEQQQQQRRNKEKRNGEKGRENNNKEEKE